MTPLTGTIITLHTNCTRARVQTELNSWLLIDFKQLLNGFTLVWAILADEYVKMSTVQGIHYNFQLISILNVPSSQ